MAATPILQGDKISVYDYRCTAGPDSKPFVERHTSHSIAYVRKGSFGCTKRGRSFELVTGSVMVGHPGDEYVCSHDHHVCGDECLSFFFHPELVDAIGGKAEVWRTGWATTRRRRPMAAATSGWMRSAMCWRTGLSRWSPDGRKNLRRRRRATAAA